jgi:hypothetical protein
VVKQKLRDVIELHALTMSPTAATAAQLADRAAAMADATQFYWQVVKDVGLPDDFIPSTADDVSKSIDDRQQHSARRKRFTLL